MVAGGGGSNNAGYSYDSNKGNAGGLQGQLGAIYDWMAGRSEYAADANARGAYGSQTSGYAFGYGGPGANTGIQGYCHGYSGGGGGYYGGVGASSTGANCHHIGGGGGSSFISGYIGCNAIDTSGSPTNQPNHFSNKIFTGGEMKAGNESMPTHDNLSTMVGNSGNGRAKITYLGI